MLPRKSSRRHWLKATAAAPAVLTGARALAQSVSWPIDTNVAGLPKLCVITPPDPAGLRQLKQLDVNHAIASYGGPIPWTEDRIRSIIDSYKAHGVNVVNMMIGGFDDVIRGGPKRDEQTEKVIQSIRAAGRAGLPVIEYNFYAHRITEGYYEELGRGGAGMTAFNHDKVKDLPALPHEGVQKREDLFKRAEGFLKAIIPECEKANVRMALHPNDPPAPLSRQSEQIMATLDHWKRYLNLVKSPYNGMTFDCGVTREMGEDPVAVCKYLLDRDCINHIHYRNVMVRKPYVDYAEVFIDNGQVNMFAVMKELIKHKYSRSLYPEHPRALDIDRKLGITGGYAKVGGGGFVGEVYNVAYTKAMMQAVLASR